MKTVRCSRCRDREDVPLEEGKQPDMPTGWSTVMVAERGMAVKNYLLCRPCTTRIKKETQK